MPEKRTKPSQILTGLALIISAVVTCALPAIYFNSGYRLMEAVLLSEAEINSRLASQIINANPTLWRFQQLKLEEFLKRRPRGDIPEARRVADLNGRVIAESADTLEEPVLRRSVAVSDAGVPVGALTISRSMRPLLYETAAVGAVGLLIGIFSFLLLRVVPLRALDKAFGENERLLAAYELRLGELTAAQARLASLYEISSIVSSTLDLQEVLRRLMTSIASIWPPWAVQVWLANAESGALERAACLNMDEAQWKGRALARVPPLVQEVVTEKRPVIVADARTDARVLDGDFYRRQGVVSYMGVPMIAHDTVVGDLVVLTKEPHRFSETDIQFICSLANQAAIAIHNSQLYEIAARKTKELERSNNELEQFAFVASHDLQEPLRMITSYTTLLAKRYKGNLDQSGEEFIAYVVDGATRMHRLINDLLAYSRVGRKEVEFARTDCEKVLADTLVSLRGAIDESGATVTHDPLPTVMGDEGQLGQLLQNLIGNSVKYRNAEPPLAHVSCTKGASEWIFSVKDNGIGIDPKYAERIFVIFQRLHNRQEYPGTGIGLAICKKIVERHGGKIWVESAPGKGSIFYFTLPA